MNKNLLINLNTWFDKNFKKYILFRKDLKNKNCFVINIYSLMLDYMFFSITHLDALFNKYHKIFAYYNINHNLPYLYCLIISSTIFSFLSQIILGICFNQVI